MKTMAYYFFKWHSRAQVLQAQLFQPLPRTQEQRGRQEREAHRALLTLQFVSTFLPTRPRSRLFWNSKTGSFSPHSCKWLTHCRKPHGDRHSPGGGAAKGGVARRPLGTAAFAVSPLTVGARLLLGSAGPELLRETALQTPLGARQRDPLPKHGIRWGNRNFDDRSSGTRI